MTERPTIELRPSEAFERLTVERRRLQRELAGYFDLAEIARESHRRHLIHGTAAPDSLTAIWGLVRHYEGIVAGISKSLGAVSAAIGTLEPLAQARPSVKLPLSTVEREEKLYAGQIAAAEAVTVKVGG